MTKRTWWYTLVTTLLVSGLAACSGGGGGGGGGGSGIPSASNAAITPPPTTAVQITNNGGGAPSQPNQSIAAHGFEASQGALTNAADPASLVVGSAKAGSGGERETLSAIVRRHAERLKDHKPSVTGALQVDTQQCTGGGTDTFAFDDASQSATEVFVNCNNSGKVLHGTLSSSNVSVVQNLGPTVGSPYVLAVTATFTIDLAVTRAPDPTVVTQGSFTFTVSINGNMQADGTGGVQTGPASTITIAMSGASLLTQNGAVRELLTNFGVTVIDNLNTSSSSIAGSYTYASTTIGGSVMVAITGAIVSQSGQSHPSSGIVTITSPGSPGKIVLTVLSPTTGVSVDVYADASGPITDHVDLTWAQVDAL